MVTLVACDVLSSRNGPSVLMMPREEMIVAGRG
jgi:hypothetical protein